MSDFNIFIESNNKKPNDLTLGADYYKNLSSTVIIKSRGVIDTYNSPDFTGAVLRLIKEVEGLSIVVLDLQELTYVSSSGVGAFIQVYTECKNSGIDLYLFRINDKIKEVLSLLGFISFFKVIDDIEDIFNKTETIFPKVEKCPSCDTKFKITKSGKFKCPSCKKEIKIDNEGKIQT